MKTIQLKETIPQGLIEGASALITHGQLSEAFLKLLQESVQKTPLAFEFTQNQSKSERSEEEEGVTYSDSEKILCFLKAFSEQLIAQRMAKGIDFKKRLTCVILLGDVLEDEGTFGSFFNQIQHLFDSEALALDYFILTNLEFLEASKAHAYSTRADIIIEFSSKSVEGVLESQTYAFNRLNEALLLLVDIKKSSRVLECPYTYYYGAYNELNLTPLNLASTLYAYLRGRRGLKQIEGDWSTAFYSSWLRLVKPHVNESSYYYYYLYSKEPFELAEGLKDYQNRTKVQALGQIQNSHLPFITAAQNAVQFGELITFADSDRQKSLRETTVETRSVIQPALSYRSYGEDGSENFEL